MCTTLPRLLRKHMAERAHAPAIREKEYGIWQVQTWAQFGLLVEQLSCGLHAIGCQRGDHLAVIGDNRPWLMASMLAAQALGAIPVPLYQDAMAAEYVSPLQDTKARWCIVEDQEQVDKLLEIRDQCPAIASIFYDDPRGLPHDDASGLAALETLRVQGMALAQAQPGLFCAAVTSGSPDDVAALFFTSGTTGKPKGVVHTHASMLDRARAGAQFDQLDAREEVFAYLPPAWFGQHIFSFVQWLYCGYVVNCPESSTTLDNDRVEVGPTYYFAPPRIFEDLRTQVMIRMDDAGVCKRVLFRVCMWLANRVGPGRMDAKKISVQNRLLYALGNVLMYRPLRNTLGLARVRVAYTAGEAIGPDLFTFYRAIGINLKQLYGATETAALVCMQPDHEVRPDTVGKPCAGVQLRFSAQGEVLVKTAGLFKAYYQNPQATAEVLDAEGWYHTGDAGFLDAQGHLHIIDRVKDAGRLTGGALFAPKYLENKLKFSAYIKEAVAIGHQRPQVCVMINIDDQAVGNWAERQGLPYAGYADLAAKAQVHDLIRDCVQQVNQDLARDTQLAGCQIHRFLVLHKELDPDDGELTRSRKVRRHFIAQKYRVLIDALYAGKTVQAIETPVRFEDGSQAVIRATVLLHDVPVFPAQTV